LGILRNTDPTRGGTSLALGHAAFAPYPYLVKGLAIWLIGVDGFVRSLVIVMS